MKKNKFIDSENLGKVYREVGPYLGLGLQLAATVALLTFAGIWMDGKFESSPVFTIIFASLGIFAGLYNFIKNVLTPPK